MWLDKKNKKYGCDSPKQIVALEFTIGDVEDEEEREEQMQRGAIRIRLLGLRHRRCPPLHQLDASRPCVFSPAPRTHPASPPPTGDMVLLSANGQWEPPSLDDTVRDGPEREAMLSSLCKGFICAEVLETYGHTALRVQLMQPLPPYVQDRHYLTAIRGPSKVSLATLTHPSPECPLSPEQLLFQSRCASHGCAISADPSRSTLTGEARCGGHR
jgi:hypothetical protein